MGEMSKTVAAAPKPPRSIYRVEVWVDPKDMERPLTEGLSAGYWLTLEDKHLHRIASAAHVLYHHKFEDYPKNHDKVYRIVRRRDGEVMICLGTVTSGTT